MQSDREGWRVCAMLHRRAAPPEAPRVPPRCADSAQRVWFSTAARGIGAITAGSLAAHAGRVTWLRARGSHTRRSSACPARVGGVRRAVILFRSEFPVPQTSPGPSSLRHPVGISCRSFTPQRLERIWVFLSQKIFPSRLRIIVLVLAFKLCITLGFFCFSEKYMLRRFHNPLHTCIVMQTLPKTVNS